MKNFLEKHLKFIGLLVAVFVSRLPFIFAGAGADPDAWRVLLTGHSLAITGSYHASRLPGYPVPEVISSIFWMLNMGTGGYWVANLLTAIVSTAAVYFFYKILTSYFPGNDNVNLAASLAFAFTPVFYIASTTIMDYVWAIAAVLGAIYFAIKERYLFSSVLMAIATGCRITSGLFLLLIIVLLLPKNLKTVAKYIGMYVVITGILFAPLWIKLGLGFLSYELEVYPSVTTIAGRVFIRTWGIPGSLGLLFAVILTVLQKKNLKITFASKNLQRQKIILLFSALSIFFYMILFIRIPLDAGYLIPVVPFVILLCVVLVPERSVYFVFGCLIVSSFVLDIHKQKLIMRGPIFSDHAVRKNEMEYAKEVLLAKSTNRTPEVIICTAHLPVISVIRLKSNIIIPPEKHFIYEISDDTVKFNPNIGPVTVSYLRDSN